MTDSTTQAGAARHRVFPGAGEMAERMRALDWAATPVGPVEAWPESLRAVVRTLLVSRYPMVLTWGPAFTQFYNDAYSHLIGSKHPGALGDDIRVTLAEGWSVLGPMIAEVMRTGVANWNPALLLLLERAGYREEAYFTVSHAPADDDEGRVAGMLAVCNEVTLQVLGERRLRLLRDLALRAGEARGVEVAAAELAAALAGGAADVPFALLYLREADGTTLRRAASVGLPASVDMDDAAWPLERAAAGETVVVDDVDRHLAVAGGPWGDAVRAALLLPLPSGDPAASPGVLVAGVSPNRALDEAYRSFFDLLAGQVSAALRSARALEEERRRAEALAELDRAKTAFFSNVSHEFRTPLTLMLGPLEEVLGAADDALPAAVREELRVVQRNALRLLRLVNTLLDFSRIEAGRADAVFEPTELGGATGELASVFRSAVERAGLRLVVDTPPLAEPVYVDRAMWEKVVLNLLSNALKHTLAGEIAVSLRRRGSDVELQVRDTGTGIPADQLPHLFQRFHRVQGARARTHEGTGIGLALVREVVELHGGHVAVESEEGRGTAFTVTLPLGLAHLPAERIGKTHARAPTAMGADAFVEESLRWVEDVAPRETAGRRRDDGRARPRVLLADDNADMRDYVARLLRARYDVVAVGDGAAALEAVRERMPELVLSDVMMPRLDGFALLRALRADPRTRALPVILLSARAGEESTVEGLDAGADDYLVKPFSARELLTRVRTHLEMSRVRRGAEERRRALEEAQEASRVKSEFMATMSHELRTPLNAMIAFAELLEMGIPAPIPDAARQQVGRIGANARHLLALIEEILTFSRVEAGQEIVRVAEVDPAAAAREAAAMIEPLAAARGLALRVDADGVTKTIRTDPHKVRQILLNFLSNAVKFTERGAVALLVSGDGDGAAFRVRDTGRGIAPEHRERIFEPFWQADQGTTRETGGTGLGLAVSRRLAHLLGGEVDVVSTPGAGSEFSLRLPADPPSSADGSDPNPG